MKKKSFLKVYLYYCIFLAVAVIACVAYVYVLLSQYEDMRPEMRVQEVMEQLTADADNGDFWTKYSLPEITPGDYEAHLNVEEQYLAQYTDGTLTFSALNGDYEEDELGYQIEKDGAALAEVTLKALGPAVTKLAVLSVREWQVVSVKPILEAVDYTISVPADFSVIANGIELTAADGVECAGKQITYTVPDVYLVPKFEIANQEGKEVHYTLKKNQVMAEFYDYSLTLPESLIVELNGLPCEGRQAGNHLMQYEIRTLEKPEIMIRDYYGNAVNYEGGNEVPMTYMTVEADDSYAVTVSGMPVPEECVTDVVNKEYSRIKDYVENLPEICMYNIAVLKEDAEVAAQDEAGNTIVLDNTAESKHITLERNASDTLPTHIAEEVDVLDIAEKWSLLVSNDLSFSQIKNHLILDSYQYNVAVQYATGVDITFTSEHRLGNPAFTDEKIANFVQITENCFYVDISFVKHMIVGLGKKVEDSMNDRFYFVKYDDTDDGVDNPMWKLASMKEIVNDEQ